MNDSFGARLRRERERQHITLAQIAAGTKIKASLFESLERDDVSRWPGGIFRRSFIRAYAEAIGLNADDVCREFTARFPETADPSLPVNLEPPVRRATPPAVAAPPPSSEAPPLLAAAPPLVAVDRFAETFAERYVAPAAPTHTRLDDEDGPSLRLTLADAGTATPAAAPQLAQPAQLDRPPTAVTPDRPAVAALANPSVTWQPLALDLGVILVVALTAFLAFGAFWMPLALISLIYFLGSTALLGRTAGAEFFAANVPTTRPAATGPESAAALDRALDVMRVEPEDGAGDARVARPYAAMRPPVDIESRRARA